MWKLGRHRGVDVVPEIVNPTPAPGGIYYLWSYLGRIMLPFHHTGSRNDCRTVVLAHHDADGRHRWCYSLSLDPCRAVVLQLGYGRMRDYDMQHPYEGTGSCPHTV